MGKLTRRELLCALASSYAATWAGCQKQDWFSRELVCIHIFGPADPLPAPLLETSTGFPAQRLAREYFAIGLPELIFCRTRMPFLEMFQYFWPFTREELGRLEAAISIEFERRVVAGTSDIEALAQYLAEYKNPPRRLGLTSAVIFTFNEFTRYWTREVIDATRGARVDEFILFKDPSRPPYLCDYPARQKGFKRPPP